MSHVNVFYLKPLKPSHRFSWFFSVTNHFFRYLPISGFYTSVWRLLTYILGVSVFHLKAVYSHPLLPVPQPPSLSWVFSWNTSVWTIECHVWLYAVCPDMWFLRYISQWILNTTGHRASWLTANFPLPLSLAPYLVYQALKFPVNACRKAGVDQFLRQWVLFCWHTFLRFSFEEITFVC